MEDPERSDLEDPHALSSNRGVTRPAASSPAHLLAEIERSLEVVTSVLPGLSEEAVEAPFPDVLGGLRPPTGLFLHHLSCHLSHHLGQAGYLRRALTGENRSSGTISMESLAGAFPNPG